MKSNSPVDGALKYRGYIFRGKIEPNSAVPLSRRGNRIGRRYGSLLVVESLGAGRRGNRWWGCRCDCGGLIACLSDRLSAEKVSSCGCQTDPTSRRVYRNPLDAKFARLYRSYRIQARYRELPFELEVDAFRGLVTATCAYCGVPPEPFIGIDRFNNTLGYVHGNVLPCCKVCNHAKATLSVEAWLSWLDRIVRNTEVRNGALCDGSAGLRPAPRTRHTERMTGLGLSGGGPWPSALGAEGLARSTGIDPKSSIDSRFIPSQPSGETGPNSRRCYTSHTRRKVWYDGGAR